MIGSPRAYLAPCFGLNMLTKTCRKTFDLIYTVMTASIIDLNYLFGVGGGGGGDICSDI